MTISKSGFAVQIAFLTLPKISCNLEGGKKRYG